MSGTTSGMNKLTHSAEKRPEKDGCAGAAGAASARDGGACAVGRQRAKAASAKSAMPAKTAAKLALPIAAPRSNAVAAALQKWSDSPGHPVSRNLFAVRMEYFPVDGSRTPQNGGPEGFWARLEKSLALQADQRDKRENLVANFTAQAGKLKLQSTMMGGSEPKAMVNGELVGEGSVVADFRVLKIEARRIIVEREGIRLEIQMK